MAIISSLDKWWLGALATLTTAGLFGYKYYTWRSTTTWVKVGKVDKLFVYPLKCGKAKDVTYGQFNCLGLVSAVYKDRTFMVINEDATSVSLKDFPRLVLVELLFEDGSLKYRAQDMDDLCIEDKDLLYDENKVIVARMLDIRVQTLHLGQRYDKWVSTFLSGKPTGYRLVYHYSDDSPLRPVRPKYRALYPETFLDTDIPTLNYTSPYTIVTWPSIHDVNRRLDFEVGPTRFRPNVVISTDSPEPFQEDGWKKRIRLGDDVILRYNKPCHRCPVTLVDPHTGEKNTQMEPLETLRTFRLLQPTNEMEIKQRKVLGQAPLLCVNCGIDATGLVKVGDDVFVEL